MLVVDLVAVISVAGSSLLAEVAVVKTWDLLIGSSQFSSIVI